MTRDELLTLSGYLEFFFLLFVFVVFYGYAYSIYKRDRTGEKDFEKYSNLVLDDSLASAPLEKRDISKDRNE